MTPFHFKRQDVLWHELRAGNFFYQSSTIEKDSNFVATVIENSAILII